MLKKSIILIILGFFFSGCSQLMDLKLKKEKKIIKIEESISFSCEEKAPPKSLQELEKKYRCTGG